MLLIGKYIINLYKLILLDEKDKNSKYQKPMIKQIPMAQIQNTKQTIYLGIYPTASSPEAPVAYSDAIELRSE